MTRGFFTDRLSKPTDKGMRNIIGEAIDNWDHIFRHLTTELNLRGDLKFYGINYGWALNFSRSGSSIVSLYPGRNCFTVQVILDKSQEETALAEITDRELLDMIRQKEPIREGKWIYIRVDRENNTEAILKLTDIRMNMK